MLLLMHMVRARTEPPINGQARSWFEWAGSKRMVLDGFMDDHLKTHASAVAPFRQFWWRVFPNFPN